MRKEQGPEQERPERIRPNFKKVCMGSISILLCLLLTPFLSVALGLVEYARYQQVMELADAVLELTGLTPLSDYDAFLHHRFGLLAASQDGNLDEGVADAFATNKAAIEGQASMDNVTVKGLTNLQNNDVLRQQIVDVSEMTALSAVLLEDFNLQELLDKIAGLSKYMEITDTVIALADLTDQLNTALEAFENLQAQLQTLSTQLSQAQANAGDFAKKMADLTNKLGQEGIMLPQEPTVAQIEAALESFKGTYLEEFKQVYASGKKVYDSVIKVCDTLSNIKTSAETVVTAVEDASKALEKLSGEDTNAADSDGSITKEAKSALEQILKEMVNIVDSSIKDLKDTTVSVAKEAMNDFVESFIENTGLSGVADRYDQIMSGDYFDYPLSDVAKQDITDFLKDVYTLYKDGKAKDPENIYNAILVNLKEKFVPKLTFNVSALKSQVEAIIRHAEKELCGEAEKTGWKLMSQLMNLVKGMFNLDVFYNGNLCAVVDLPVTGERGYQLFLSAIGDVFDGITEFSEAVKKVKPVKALKAMKKMLNGIVDMLKAIFDIVRDMFSSLMELRDAVVGADIQTLYEKVLISGYMAHSLPNRTSAGEYDPGDSGISVKLTGTSLTGFSYDDIPRPARFSRQSGSFNFDGTKFQQLAKLIENLKNDGGSDTMFMGAELEYIRAGTNSELANQVICFMDLYFLRLLLNLPNIFSSTEINSIAAAATIGAWVVYILYILAEPFLDTIILVNGGEVALLKGSCWLTSQGIDKFIEALLKVCVKNEALRNEVSGLLQDEGSSFMDSYSTGAKDTFTSGVMPREYRSYILLVLFIFVESDVQLDRLQDIIYLEARQYYKNNGGTFSLKKAYTSVLVTAELQVDPLFDFGALTGDSFLIPAIDLKQIISY